MTSLWLDESAEHKVAAVLEDRREAR